MQPLPDRSTVSLAQGEVAYRDLGEGDPIVFVHGLLVDGRLWDGVAERLARGHRCLVFDWPLGSHRIAMDPAADLSPPGIAELIATTLDALEIERATIVGNDSGGAISQMFTAAHPERVGRLVLTNCDILENFPPFPFNLMPPLARMPGGMALMTAPFRIGAIGRATFAPLAKHRIDPVLVESWLEPALGDREIARDARKLITGVHKSQTIEAAERLRDFERPVRFAWGVDDRFFRIASAERLAAMLRDARIERIEDARTFVALDQPDRVAELIGEFALA